MAKVKKVPMLLSKSEFRAMLIRHAEEDVEQWEEPGMHMFLRPDEVTFIEAMRQTKE